MFHFAIGTRVQWHKGRKPAAWITGTVVDQSIGCWVRVRWDGDQEDYIYAWPVIERGWLIRASDQLSFDAAAL